MLDESFLHRSLACEDLFLFSLSRFCHARHQPRPQAKAAEIAAALVRYRLRKSHEDQKECKVWISTNVEIINKIRKLIQKRRWTQNSNKNVNCESNLLQGNSGAYYRRDKSRSATCTYVVYTRVSTANSLVMMDTPGTSFSDPLVSVIAGLINSAVKLLSSW